MTTMILTLLCLLPALINPSLQPAHLAERFSGQVLLRIDSAANGKATLRVERLLGGAFVPTAITLQSQPERQREFSTIAAGSQVVGFLGRLRKPEEGMLYVGGGKFLIIRANPGDQSTWTLVGDADEGKAENGIMFGTFNGRVDRLAELLADAAAKRGYFPAKPFTAFTAEPLSGSGALALADFDGDGRCDMLAGRVLRLQAADGSLQAAPALPAGCGAGPATAADLDGDGRCDLLSDGQLWLNQGGGRLVSGARVFPSGLRQILTADLDGDGRGDLIGLDASGRLLLARAGAAGFTDVGAELTGLLGSMQISDAGRLAVGDLDGDGRCDLVCSAGVVLLNAADGWQPMPLPWVRRGEHPGSAQPVIATLWSRDAAAIFVNAGENRLLAWEGGGPLRAERFANEMQDRINAAGATIAADLNADGLCDLYLAGAAAGDRGAVLTNRGYGSWMAERKYAAGAVVPDAVLGRGARALATGDVDGDGDLDLLVEAHDGATTLLRNQAAQQRLQTSGPEATAEVRWRTALHLLRVVPQGRGAVGATVTAACVGAPPMPAQVQAGQAGGGSDLATILAVPAGTWTVTVRFSDGKTATQSLTAPAGGTATLVMAAP